MRTRRKRSNFDRIRHVCFIFREVFLGQGTLRPDLIESASKMVSGTADVIKTHHNDTDLVRKCNSNKDHVLSIKILYFLQVRKLRASGKVVEPLSDFHKDEVRFSFFFALFGLIKELYFSGSQAWSAAWPPLQPCAAPSLPWSWFGHQDHLPEGAIH